MPASGPTPAPAELPLPPCLTTVLSRSGHRCGRGFVADDPALGRVRVSRHFTSRDAAPVVVNLAQRSELLSVHHLVRTLNDCTRKRGIGVLPRRADGRGRASAGAFMVPA
ncbi:MAG: hypothetical protein ABI692_00770 [Terracoccus sp.]